MGGDYQHNLLRAEQLLEAGSVYEREFDETVVRLTSQAAALEQGASEPGGGPLQPGSGGQWRPLTDRAGFAQAARALAARCPSGRGGSGRR